MSKKDEYLFLILSKNGVFIFSDNKKNESRMQGVIAHFRPELWVIVRIIRNMLRSGRG